MKFLRCFANFAFYVFPVLFITVIVLAELTLTLPEKQYFYSEYGAVEASHEFGLFLSFLFGLWFLRHIKSTESKWLKIWIGIATLGCFLSLGEEISWGQTIFHWQTPEEWAQLNGQGETNLHNMSHWLNQLPKAIVEIGVLIGGIIIPLLKKYRPDALPKLFEPIYAGSPVLPTACLALIVKILELAPGELGVQVFWRKSEVIESVLFHFAFVYLLYIFFKWKAEDRLNL